MMGENYSIRVKYSLLISFIFHVILLWILSYFIISQTEPDPKFITVGFIKEDYLPQPLKVSSIKKSSKLGIPESSVLLKDLRFSEIDRVELPYSRSFKEEVIPGETNRKEIEKKVFDISEQTPRIKKGDSHIERDNPEDLYPDVIDIDVDIPGEGTGDEETMISISGKELERRKIVEKPTIPSDIKLKENVKIELDFEVTPTGNPVNISPVVIGDQELLELSISLIQQYRWEKVDTDKNARGRARIIFKLK